MKYLKLCVILLLPLWSVAQHNLTARIVDKETQPVAFANALLFQMPDSTFYKATTSDEKGKLSFTDVSDGDYVLNISSVGYVTLSRKLTIKTTTDLNDLEMAVNQEELDAVTVTAKRPTVQRKADRIIFNVENTSVSTGNAADILSVTPGIVAMNGEYLVKNKAAVVYINNRRVYLTSDELNQLLNGYTGDNVKSVEVITNPPAQYDADGAAVINIVTSTNVSLGYKGSVNGSWTVDTFAKYQVGLSQYYKNKWLNVYANYNYNPRKDLLQAESQIGFFNPDGSRSDRWFMNMDRIDRSAAHAINTTIDIQLSDRSTVSIMGNLNINENQDAVNNVETLILQNGATEFSGFNTESAIARNKNNGWVTAGLLNELGENGATLNLEASHVFVNGDANQDLFSTFFDTAGATTSTNSFNTIANLDIAINALKLDYSGSLGDYSVTTGLKFTDIATLSGQDFFDTNSGSVLDPANSDLFDYSETIYAAYVQLERDWDKWSVSGGLRAEQTEVVGDSRSLGLVNTQDYLGLFPNLSLSHYINESNTLSLTYKRSIERPGYNTLNPFNYFINDANVETGNPNLQPAFTNDIGFTWDIDNTYTFDLYYSRTDDIIDILTFQDNQNQILINQDANLNFEQQYSFDFSVFKYLTDRWIFYTQTSLFYQENEFIGTFSNNETVRQNTTGFYIATNNFFQLNEKGTLNMDIKTTYISSLLYGSNKVEGIFGSSIGLSQQLWDNRALLTLKYNDIFLSQNQVMRTKYLNQDNQSLSLPETQTFSLGFIYKFGNFRLENREATPPKDIERTTKKTREI